MKIIINYDLFVKIEEAKRGFSLEKTANRVLILTAISTGLAAIIYSSLKEALKEIHNALIIHSLFRIPEILILSKLNKRDAAIQLMILSQNLRNINVNTDYKMLLKSENYKTDYEISFDEGKLPRIEQKKYIMVPTYQNGEYEEVSLVQEHIIGSKSYVISYGSPKKKRVLKLSYNPI